MALLGNFFSCLKKIKKSLKNVKKTVAFFLILWYIIRALTNTNELVKATIKYFGVGV